MFHIKHATGCAWRATYLYRTRHDAMGFDISRQLARIVLDPSARQWTKGKRRRFASAWLFIAVGRHQLRFALPEAILGHKLPWWKLDGRRAGTAARWKKVAPGIDSSAWTGRP
jgi:hypothetical protein